MSFDLAVWHSSKPMTDEAAGQYYMTLCQREEPDAPQPLIEANPAVAAFVSELTIRYPDLSSFDDDTVDDAVWNADLDVSPGHCIMTIGWSRAEQVYEFVVPLAAKHGLCLYDPQDGKLHPPPGQPPERKRGFLDRLRGR
jgi:hypothetical protein